MTGILFWNVNNFSLGKLQDNTSPATTAEAAARCAHMLTQVIAPVPPGANPPPLPDIIIIVEVYDRNIEISRAGRPLNPGGTPGQGVILMLNLIRTQFGHHWCAVPPLSLGDGGNTEGVAVFYNSLTLQFTGPNIIANDNGLISASTAYIANMANYQAAWTNALPAGRTWPSSPGGPAVPEQQSAGQWQYFVPPGVPLYFPDTYNRPPFYTRLVEVAPPNRTIKVFSVHTSPATASQATRNIGHIPELTLANNEVGVVVGDFNVDSFDMANNGSYRPIIDRGYTWLLDPRSGGAVRPDRQPYCMTHFLPTNTATPYNDNGWPTDAQHDVYPRFGYMGQMIAGNISSSGAIDNAFVGYGSALAAPPHQTTIVNTITGKPYTALNPLPATIGPDLTGGYSYLSSLQDALPLPGGYNWTNIAALARFRLPANFGVPRDVSDHLALRFDV